MFAPTFASSMDSVFFSIMVRMLESASFVGEQGDFCELFSKVLMFLFSEEFGSRFIRRYLFPCGLLRRFTSS